MNTKKVDVLLIGGGAMSASLGLLLKQLNPNFSMLMVEKLGEVAEESTQGWNNAGTGHAAYCELNYTPQAKDGSIDTHAAFGVNARFEVSLQYWAYLVRTHQLPSPQNFIMPAPHISFVWGKENVEFLRKRHSLLIEHPMFSDMEFTQDKETLKKWIPLVMQGRDPDEIVAATRVAYGADINFGAICCGMTEQLKAYSDFELLVDTSVIKLKQAADKMWQVQCRTKDETQAVNIEAKFVFIGAGGGTLPLLQKSGIAESVGFAGFPVSGQWLVCKKPEIVDQHISKVYGKASVGAPPMSVPHLDRRLIDGEASLLFGPFAGVTTKFLKQGSFFDIFTSIRPKNIWPMISVGLRNFDLIRYLISEVRQDHDSRMKALRNYFPEAKNEDWTLITAGQRVQIIKPCSEKGGKLELGTEVVSSADGTLSSLMGASPGASVMAAISLQVIEECFSSELESEEWQAKIQEIFPSYGISIVENIELFKSIHEKDLDTLALKTSPQ